MPVDPTPSSEAAVAAAPTTDAGHEHVQLRLNRASVIDGISRRAVHDLRNSLQAITMASETLRDDPRDEDGPELIALIVDAASAADNTLRCVGPTPFRIGSEPEPLVLPETIDWVVDALTPRRIPDGIEIAVSLPTLPPVMAMEGQLRHVLLNVVINAREALVERGTGTVSITATADEKTVALTIGDDGPGVRRDVADRIFEPFVTTKSRQEHLGLGLPVAARLLRGWGGSLECVRTDAGAGGCFVLRFAAARGLGTASEG